MTASSGTEILHIILSHSLVYIWRYFNGDDVDDVDDDDVDVDDHDDDDGITWQWRQPLYDPKNFSRYHLLK